MYDPRSEAHEFVAEKRDEAIAQAAAFYGVSAEDLVIQDVDPSEVSGLGARQLIVAIPRELVGRPRAAPAPRGEPRERDRERGGRDRDRGRERGGRGRERGSGRERERRPAPEPPDVPVLGDEPSVGTARGDLGEWGRFVLGVIERMDVGSFELTETEEGELRVFEVGGGAASALAAGEGRAVDALQLLVNQAVLRSEGESAKRAVLEVEGNPEARERFLTRLAQRVASRARSGERSVALDPMSARDRRIIHVAVRDEEGVVSMSIGEGRYRQVLVVPEGAPEWDEASRQSDSSGH